MSDCKITINGKSYRCAFTMLQMELSSKLSEKQDTSTGIGACGIYTAVQMAARQDKIALDITFDDVLLWYDDAFSNDNPEVEAFNEAFKQSAIYKKLTATDADEEKKSQSTLTKQEPLPLVS